MHDVGAGNAASLIRGGCMRKAWIVVSILCFLGCMVIDSGVYAKGLYVRDRVNVPLKRAPGENSQVIGMASTNDYLTVKEESGEWIKVTTPDGQEGWVSARLLTTETPRALIIEQLNEKVRELSDTIKTLQEQNKTVEKENRDLKYNVGALSSDVGKSKEDYDKLREASTTYLELKADYDKLVNDDKAKSAKIEELAKENSRFKTSERAKFTFVGGGFILIGIILGGILQSLRSKPHRSGYKM